MTLKHHQVAFSSFKDLFVAAEHHLSAKRDTKLDYDYNLKSIKQPRVTPPALTLHQGPTKEASNCPHAVSTLLDSALFECRNSRLSGYGPSRLKGTIANTVAAQRTHSARS